MNTISITGNLTDSKGINQTTNSAVARRSIAENFSKDHVQFTDLEAWNSNKNGDMADLLDSFPKGEYVTVSGFLKHGSYQNNEGKKIRTTVVVVSKIERAERPAKKNTGAKQAVAAGAGASGYEEESDSSEIPF
jgi:single-stranded DNA-binding protein